MNKNITIELTSIQAVTLYRVLNRDLQHSVSELVIEHLQGKNGRSDILDAAREEFDNYRSDSIWKKLDTALEDAGIVAEKFEVERPIKAGEYDVQFGAGEIKVGCQTIPNSVVREIAKRLKD